MNEFNSKTLLVHIIGSRKNLAIYFTDSYSLLSKSQQQHDSVSICQLLRWYKLFLSAPFYLAMLIDFL